MTLASLSKANNQGVIDEILLDLRLMKDAGFTVAIIATSLSYTDQHNEHFERTERNRDPPNLVVEQYRSTHHGPRPGRQGLSCNNIPSVSQRH